MTKTNSERAERAEAALAAYIEHTGDGLRANDLETWIGDLMCDMRHLCAFLGQRFPENGGSMNFETEVQEDPSGPFEAAEDWLLDEPCIQHRDCGRGTCIDCGAAIPGSKYGAEA